MNSIELVQQLLARLSARRRLQFSLSLALMVLSGVAEAVSLAAVMPFLWVLTNPEKLLTYPLAQQVVAWFGVVKPADLLFPAAALFVAAVLAAAAIRLTNVWLGARLSAAIGSDLSADAFQRSIYQPYDTHLARNSSVLITSMTSQLELTVLALSQFLQMLSASAILIGLLVCLFLVDWQVALLCGAVACAIYGIIVGIAKSALLRNGEHITRAQTEQVKILRESFGAIRDLILNGSQRFFFETYRKVDRPMRRRQAQNQFLSLYPRYAVEAVGMVAIVVLAYWLVSRRGAANEVVPLLGILALAAQRLLPTVQLIYTAWSDIRSKAFAVRAVLDVLSQPLPPGAGPVQQRPLPLTSVLSFEHVSFGYATDAHVLHDISFKIKRGERVGIIGTTGSGKSTTLDLLMGLLAPTTGRISIDGTDLHDAQHPERLPAWRAAISHVPQSVYLADSSFAANIAFGVESSHIDMERVRHAARQAQIAEFIERSPGGYGGTVGERGVRLSGGQRQRIGIARALYRQSQILIFDEATNALDATTEQAVVESIDALSSELTVVVVAHRLSTLKNCDRIVELEAGRVHRVGTYQAMIDVAV